MKKGRSTLFIFSALYVIAAVLSLRNAIEYRADSEKPAAPFGDRRVFCWNEAGKIYEKTGDPAAVEVHAPAPDQTADLDADGLEESYVLADGVLTVRVDGEIVWQSGQSWKVDSFVLGDANNDGVSDLNLSVWKPGNFGDLMPFWVEENDMSVKNHFFIYDLKDGKMRPVWQSSNLTAPNCRLDLADTDLDGKNELVVIEGDYADPACQGRYVAVWKWKEWGFRNEWRSEAGDFENLETGIGGKENCFMGF